MGNKNTMPKLVRGQALFRSYGHFFAEFLGDLSLVRLALLELITCVGLRYGSQFLMLREFSRKRALLHLPPAEAGRFSLRLEFRLAADEARICQSLLLTPRTTNPIMREAYCAPSSRHYTQKSWNINHVSIGCGSHHSLRAD